MLLDPDAFEASMAHCTWSVPGQAGASWRLANARSTVNQTKLPHRWLALLLTLMEPDTRHTAGETGQGKRIAAVASKGLTAASPSPRLRLPRQEVGIRRHDFEPEMPSHGLQGGHVASAPLPAGQ
jgi:hypothetical protein